MGAEALEYDPLTFEVQDDPYPFYRHLLNDEPLYHSPERGFWALSRFEDVRVALKDWRTFSSAEGVNLEKGFTEAVGPEILNMDPPRHDELRRVVRHFFTKARIDDYRSMVETFADELLGRLISIGGGDFATDFSQRLPVLVISILMGIPSEDEATVRGLAGAMLTRESGSAELSAEALAAGEELRAYFGSLVDDRRTSPRDDIISALATDSVDGDPMSSEEIFGMCVILYLAGNTTTSSLISNGLHVLARHPEQRARLAANPQAIPDALEELLRYESPVQYTSRITTTEVEMYDQVIPKGERVMLLIGAAHRDERQWESPDTLDVFRTPRRNLAFGEGIHLCIGAPLARLEGTIAFSKVLARIPNYELAGDIKRLYLSTERGLARLPLSV